MENVRHRGGGDADVGVASFASLQFFSRYWLFACLDADEMDEWCASLAENEIKGSATQRSVADIENNSTMNGRSVPRRAQALKIEKALHRLGHELLAIQL